MYELVKQSHVLREFIAHSYVNKFVIYSMNPDHLYSHNFMLVNKVKSM